MAAISSSEIGLPFTSLCPRLASPKLSMSRAVERQATGGIPSKDRPTRSIVAVPAMSLGHVLHLLPRGTQRRVMHAQGLQNLIIELVVPGRAGRRHDQVAEQADTGVGVP